MSIDFLKQASRNPTTGESDTRATVLEMLRDIEVGGEERATTARVAGVPNVIACSPTHRKRGVHPAILYTADLAGADTRLALGGVQGIEVFELQP